MRQDDVAFGDAADAGLQNLHADFVGAELVQRALDGFGRTLHVGLEHDAAAACFSPAARVLSSWSSVWREFDAWRCFAALAGAVFRDFAGARFDSDHDHFVAGFRRRRKTQHFDGRGGTGFLHRLAAIVGQQAHPAPFRTGDDDVADLQRAALYQHGGDGAAALVQLGFDDRAFGGAIGIGLEVEKFGLQQDGFFAACRG